MKPFSSLKVALALTASVHTLLAEPDRTQKPQPGPAPAASFPHYQLRELSNGLKVFVIEDDRKPSELREGERGILARHQRTQDPEGEDGDEGGGKPAVHGKRRVRRRAGK